MAKRSKTVQTAVNRLYATMAAAAAQQALNRIKWKEPIEADRWALFAVGWMDKSSADAIKWHYSNPRIET